MVALIGCVCFPASFALFHYAVPLGAWAAAAPELLVSAFAAGLTTVLAMLIAGIGVTRRMQVDNTRMRVAINNMSQGLCMFDRNERLVVCNRRYMELYKLPDDVVKPGRTLASLLEFRIANGSFSRDPDEYRHALVSAMAQGKTTTAEVKSDSGTRGLRHQPADGGRRLGGDARGHHRTARRRARTRRDAGAAAAPLHHRPGDRRVPPARRGSPAHGDRRRHGHALHRHRPAGEFRARPRSARMARWRPPTKRARTWKPPRSPPTNWPSSIGEISRQLATTTTIVRAAVEEAQGTNAQISALSQAAQKIGDVIKLIRTIAGQTNLLALNATIEAARAGEAGKGFAVVASEVKSLAVQTAKATEDISRLIGAVQTSTGSAVDAIGRIASRMQEIDSCTTSVSAAVQQQSAATSEISQNVAGAADGAKLVVSVLGNVTGAATETRQSAESVLTASQAVEAAAAELRHEVEGFLARVAA